MLERVNRRHLKSCQIVQSEAKLNWTSFHNILLIIKTGRRIRRNEKFTIFNGPEKWGNVEWEKLEKHWDLQFKATILQIYLQEQLWKVLRNIFPIIVHLSWLLFPVGIVSKTFDDEAKAKTVKFLFSWWTSEVNCCYR